MKFAVVGCGSMGSRRIRYLQHLKAGQVLGYDIREDRRVEADQQFQIQTVRSVQELIAAAPSAIFVCVPPAEHMFYLKLALESGWHFMTEQPISSSLDGLDALAAGVREKRLVAHVSCNMRFNQGVRLLRDLITQDTIGPVRAGLLDVGEWLPDWHPYEPYTDYYPARRAKGGGLDAICDLEWLRHLFGDITRMACFAGKRSSLDIDTDDVVQLLLDFREGPMVTLHTDMLQRCYSHKAKFIGEKGSLEWDCSDHSVRLYRAETKQWERLPEAVDLSKMQGMKMKPGWEWVEPMYLDDSRAFLSRLEQGDKSLDSLKTGIENARLVLDALACSNEYRVARA